MTKDEALKLAHRALSNKNAPTKLIYEAITAIKAALEAKDEAWECVCGANLYIDANGIPRSKASVEPATVMFKPEQEAKDEPVQTIPNFDQLQQIVNNLERCLTRDSKHEFLRVWIRDWTEHKLSKRTSAALEAKDEPVAWRYDQAKYRTNDLRGRQWAFNVFSQARPYMDEMVQNVTPLYTTPPKRKPLTDEEIERLWPMRPTDDVINFARAIEAAHGITGEYK